jgi:hypothetical protein
MKADDVTATLDLALKTSGLDQAKVIRRPRLLSDNGSSYIAADLAKWLDGQNMEHVRGAGAFRRAFRRCDVENNTAAVIDAATDVKNPAVSIMIRSSVRERADDNKVWVVRNTTICGRGIVKRGETKRRQLRHPAPPVSASYVGDSSLGLSVDAGSPEYRSNETRSTTTRFIFSTRTSRRKDQRRTESNSCRCDNHCFKAG